MQHRGIAVKRETSVHQDYLFQKMPVQKAVLSLAIPTVISQVITVIYNMADTFFVGQLNDPGQVAAVAVSMPAFVVLTALANLFGIGGAGRIARCLGEGKRKEAAGSAALSIRAAVLAALAYGLAVLGLQRWLLPFLGAKADTYGYCAEYLLWTVTVGAVPTVLGAVLSHLIRAEGYAKEAGFGVAFGGVLNMLLDPIFIFGFGLEIAGAAIATMLSNAAAVGYFLWVIYRKREQTVIDFRRALWRDKAGRVRGAELCGVRVSALADIVTGGLPSCIMMLMGCVSNGVLNRLLTAHSTEAMAGMGIAKKIDMMAFAVAQGMTQGVLPLVAYNYASGNRKRMSATIRVTLTITLSIAALTMLGLFFLAKPIVACFIEDAATVEHGQTFLRIICFICPSTAINYMIITIFQATKQKIQPLVLSVLRKGSLDVPLMLLLNYYVGVKGIAWATPLADWTALVVSLGMFVPFVRRFLNER